MPDIEIHLNAVSGESDYHQMSIKETMLHRQYLRRQEDKCACERLPFGLASVPCVFTTNSLKSVLNSTFTHSDLAVFARMHR